MHRRRFLETLALASAARFSPASIGAPLELAAVRESTLFPFTGPSISGVDRSTLSGRTVCGYQGWFNADGDGAERGWVHWTKNGKQLLAPGNVNVDLWPDVSELAPHERFATGFRHADGRIAEVFSSFRRETVLRHFRWMRDYGIDGAFVQRFAVGLRDPRVARHHNTVLAHCREGAHLHGRSYNVMYDLSGLGAERIQEVIDDWKLLRERMRIGEDAAYQRHRGRPLVSVWGVGFSDQRKYTLAECRRLIEFLKSDGCAVMLGVPTFWRELRNDAAADPHLHDVLQLADILSPWTVGRFRDSAGAARHGEKLIAPDLAWCAERGLDYLPVLFPGFSWHNLKSDPLDAIPRRRGEFFWSQFQAAVRAGASMGYVAMFDEVDEATAIFKCTNDVPVGEGASFVTYEGQPSDRYLRLTGEGARLIRRELPPETPLPPPTATGR